MMPTFSRVAQVVVITSAVLLMLGFGGCPPAPPPQPPLNPLTLLPTDPSPTCVVTPAVFATWFQPVPPATTGAVTLNGIVNPANSVTFPNTPNCSFYQWSEQMFLWLTSPAPATYGGGGGLVMDSPAFYDVSPPAADGSRTFLPHTSGLIRTFGLRAAQVGPQGLQLIFDTSGKLFQFKPAAREAKPLVREASGKTVEIKHVRLGKDRKPILLDTNGKIIRAVPPEAEKAAQRAEVTQMAIAQRFLIDGIPIFVDPSLGVIDVEQGQAGGNGVLEALPGGSLVYYATMVNDVFAYFATGVKDGAISANQFPTTASDLSNITTFASAHGKTFPDPNALTVEVKSAWVEAAALPNLSSYITMNATIPTYDESNPNTWTPGPAPGQKTVKLALVGIHVVGSTAGHPEMIWATFEHFANVPRATYSYVNTGNSTVSVNQNTNGSWVFAKTNSSGPFNQEHMSFSAPNIVAASGFTISPSDTIRWKAFGAASDVSPNPIDGSSAASNTEIIAIDNSISGMIASGDVRSNYVMTGATWTIGGASPNSGNQVGTSALSNTTMETYQQGTDTTMAHGGTNCFTCHISNTTGVSHVFVPLKPLF
jgi:hypothetical protein